MERALSKELGVFIRFASKPVPRVLRMMSVARDLGYRVRFVGGHREPDRSRVTRWEGVSVVRLGIFAPPFNGRRALVYLYSVFCFWCAVFRHLVRFRPGFIHASDVEAVVPAVLYRLIFRIPVLFNIHDNLSVRYQMDGRPNRLLNVIEGALARASNAVLVPEGFRANLLPEWTRTTVFVVRNTPDVPAAVAPPRLDATPIVMYAGWLDFGRGLLDLVELADRGLIRLRVAGEGDESLLERVKGSGNVEYLGYLTHDAVIAETAKCHFVAALYNPARLINVYAASNKLSEALALGRPVIINDGLAIAPELRDAKCAVIVEYNDTQSIAEGINKVYRDPEYKETSAASRVHYEAHYHPSVADRSSRAAYLSAGLKDLKGG